MRLLIVFLLFVSCNNNQKVEKVTVIETKLSVESKMDNSEINFSDFENKVFGEIEKIKNSNSDTRKEHLNSFASYSNVVDGAMAERYSCFAFEYPNDNIFDFFSVLTMNDTALLNKWASIASSELMLIKENIENPNEFETNLEQEFEVKIDKKLTNSHKAIAEFYFEKLIKYSNPKN